ncbi:MAG TPA: hypothetical protein VF040_21690 [Ktedonobacterales bacterium]
MNMLGLLFRYIFRSFFHLVFSSLFFAMISAGLVLLISFLATHTWPPSSLTVTACVVIAILAAYAVTMTVLASEAIAENARNRAASNQTAGNSQRSEKGVEFESER